MQNKKLNFYTIAGLLFFIIGLCLSIFIRFSVGAGPLAFGILLYIAGWLNNKQ